MSKSSLIYTATTRKIVVSVRPEYLSSQSDPDEDQFIWAYHVVIRNDGDGPVRLLTRHWIISDALGRTQEIKGDGVIGEQPVIKPGKQHDYSSGVPLGTPSGIMRGSYQMISEDGTAFDVEIPAFWLESPDSSPTVN